MFAPKIFPRSDFLKPFAAVRCRYWPSYSRKAKKFRGSPARFRVKAYCRLYMFLEALVMSGDIGFITFSKKKIKKENSKQRSSNTGNSFLRVKIVCYVYCQLLKQQAENDHQKLLLFYHRMKSKPDHDFLTDKRVFYKITTKNCSFITTV